MKYVENEKLNLLIKFAMYDYEDPDVEEFKNLDDSDVVFSEKYYARKKRLLNKYRMRQKLVSAKKVLSAVSVACLIIVLSIGISIVSVSSLRKAVWNAIIEWYEDYFTIRYEMPEEVVEVTTEQATDATTEYSADGTTNQDTDELNDGNGEEVPTDSQQVISVTPPTKIETVKKPTYLPNGVEGELVIQNKATILYEYYNGDDFVFYYTQTVYKSDEKHFDSESARVREIESGEYKFLLIEYKKNTEKVLLWDDKMYLYKITFEDASIDEMINVAKSVQ